MPKKQPDKASAMMITTDTSGPPRDSKRDEALYRCLPNNKAEGVPFLKAFFGVPILLFKAYSKENYRNTIGKPVKKEIAFISHVFKGTIVVYLFSFKRDSSS